ncbi:hypothetical protein [Kordia sp.]|uniref:hypothetical protein n=1 Tax=Kordia sp. TaxID=1965332 RepID=UPI003D29BDBC
MSDINILIDYLNPRKKEAESSHQYWYHLTILDEDYIDSEQDFLSGKVKTMRFNSLPAYRSYSDRYQMIITSYDLYATINDEGIISFYFKRVEDEIIKYISLHDFKRPGRQESDYVFFDELNVSSLTEILLNDILYYDVFEKKLFTLFIEHPTISIQGLKSINYNPKDLNGLSNGIYEIQHDDRLISMNMISMLRRVTDAKLNPIGLHDGEERPSYNVKLTLNPINNKIYVYPKIKGISSNKITLIYEYKPTLDESSIDAQFLGNTEAIKLEFNSNEAFLVYMMAVYFSNGISPLQIWKDKEDNTGSSLRRVNFFRDYANRARHLIKRSTHDPGKLLTYLQYIPGDFYIKDQDLYKEYGVASQGFEATIIWEAIGNIFEVQGNLKLTEKNGTHFQKLAQTLTIGSGEIILQRTYDIILYLLEVLLKMQEEKEVPRKQQGDYILENLMKRKVDGESFLQLLYGKFNGNDFVTYNLFIYKAWIQSSYTNPNHKLYADTTPYINDQYNDYASRIVFPYETSKIIGFYTSNMNMSFNEKGNIVVTPDESWLDNIAKTINPALGYIVEQFAEDDWIAEYHPLQPIFLADVSNKNAVNVQKFSPMMLLKANEEIAFWENVALTIDYGLDVISTVSGVGNLAKFRHLNRLVKNALKINKSRKLKKVVHIYSAFDEFKTRVEISLDLMNIVIKMADIEDTEFGKALNSFMFWVEMLTLIPDVAELAKAGFDAIKSVRASARNVAKSKKLKETLDKLVKKKIITKAEKGKFIGEINQLSKFRHKIDNFIARNIKNENTIGDIPKKIIYEQLHNITDTSTKVSRHIKKNKIKIIKLDEDDFYKAIKEPYEKIEDLKKVRASQKENIIYLRNDSPLDKAFGEIVHEGQHAMDDLAGLMLKENEATLRKLTSEITHDKIPMEGYVKKMTRNQVIELRARIAEREFQIAGNLNPDFSSVEAMISHIYKHY